LREPVRDAGLADCFNEDCTAARQAITGDVYSRAWNRGILVHQTTRLAGSNVVKTGRGTFRVRGGSQRPASFVVERYHSRRYPHLQPRHQ